MKMGSPFFFTGAYVMLNPTGTWSFVGSVPADLAYEGTAEDIAAAAKFGAGIVRQRARRQGRTFRTRTWATRQAAIDFAHSLGHTVVNENDD